MAVRLSPITAADIRPLTRIKVREDQDDFVAPNPVTIAQARFETGAYDFCIWNDDARIGLIAMVDMAEHDDRSEIDDPEAMYVWRLLIGEEFQGKGYGKATMTLAEEWARERGRPLMQIQAVEENHAAIALYEALGYRRTGKMSEGEIQLEKRL